MSTDKNKALHVAERLLRQGKLQEALSELQRNSAPDDLLTLNRMGDLLARQGRNAEAIDYYRKIAQRFEQNGFLSKAVAIHKKIVRLDTKNAESLVRLGELNVLLRLTGEARNYLLLAAELYLAKHQFDRARDVYQKLVKSEPNEPRHRVRLAEARAAAGDTETAGRELEALGRSLLEADKAAEAEKIYRRSAELLEGRAEPLIGIARCLQQLDRREEALGVLRQAAAGPTPDPQLLGELALGYELAGHSDEALRILEQAQLTEIPLVALQQLFRLYLERGQVDVIWQRLDPVLAHTAQRDAQAAQFLLESLAELEGEGHVPALQRLLELQGRIGDQQGMVRTLEWLVRSYESHSMHDEASLMRERLREIAPGSPVLGDDLLHELPGADAAGVGFAPEGGEPQPLDTEAPAVPVTRAEQEFAAGRLTQAEILEKYGLRQQALEQLREVTTRFPGHVEGLQRLVEMLRTGAGKQNLADTLARLALALRAVGATAEGARAAREAAALGELSQPELQALEQVNLLQHGDAAAADPEVEESAPLPPQVAATGTGDGASAQDQDQDQDQDEVVIEFEEAGAASATPHRPAARAPARGSPTRAPSQDMLDEIRYYIEQGQREDAARRVQALGALGYASPELDELATSMMETADLALAEAPAEDWQATAGNLAAHSTMAADDDDLDAITDALEQELLREADFPQDPPLVPQASSDQSLDDIFAAFKHHVQEEVGSDDYRTHYDLGIAYKEMGLMDEAIREFEIVTRFEALYREACSMMAICHRDRSEMSQAARWYRQALEAPGGDAEAQSGLRYDLAEVLLESGDTEGALDLFRNVMRANPSFRDVRSRVSELESQMQS